jgi:hypothetical protein
MGFFASLLGPSKPPTADAVNFDDTGYAYQGEKDGQRVWFLPGGGGIGLSFQSVTPRLPKGLDSFAQVADCYAAALGANQRLVECRSQSLDGVSGIWLIICETQSGSPMTYLGSLTLPFEDCSFVLKIQCQEQGITGAREAVVLDAALKTGQAQIIDGKVRLRGASFESPEFDLLIPTHPLSRVRAELWKIAGSLRIDRKALAKKKPFELPREGD